MTARLQQATQPFMQLLKQEQPFTFFAKTVGTAIGSVDHKIEEWIHRKTQKHLLAHSCMFALRATPFIVANLNYSTPTQLVGAATAFCMRQGQRSPSHALNSTIKATHALTFAFFLSSVIDVTNNPFNSLSVKTAIDVGLTAAFMWLANQAEAPNKVGNCIREVGK